MPPHVFVPHRAGNRQPLAPAPVGIAFPTGTGAGARATKLARPGTVLATAPVWDAVPAAAGLRFVAVPRRRLKGFDNPVTLFAVELGAALRHGA
jgi:class 3 adenylate cyclase